MSWDDYYTGLTGIINYIFSGGRNSPWRDPMLLPVYCSLSSRNLNGK